MDKFSISNTHYTYLHDQNDLYDAIDTHHIMVKRSGAKALFVYISTFVLLVYSFYLYAYEEKSITLVLLFNLIFVKILLWTFIKGLSYYESWIVILIAIKSVVIMPPFGVQLETHYMSGKVTRHFVPIDKFLKPVLLECVTPMTCYWTLSLLVRGESELMLIFKNLRPPVKMLVHVWKALCAGTDSKRELGKSTVEN